MAGWDPERAVHRIAQGRAAFAGGTTTFLTDPADRYKQVDAPDYRLRGSSPPKRRPVSVIERADAVGISAFQAFA